MRFKFPVINSAIFYIFASIQIGYSQELLSIFGKYENGKSMRKTHLKLYQEKIYWKIRNTRTANAGYRHGKLCNIHHLF